MWLLDRRSPFFSNSVTRKLEIHTLRISSVPKRDLNILESIALTEPIYLLAEVVVANV